MSDNSPYDPLELTELERMIGELEEAAESPDVERRASALRRVRELRARLDGVSDRAPEQLDVGACEDCGSVGARYTFGPVYACWPCYASRSRVKRSLDAELT